MTGLGLAALAWAHAPAQAADILVVDYNLIPGLATNLSTIAATAGDTVTVVNGLSAGNMPVTLAGFAQVWDLGANQPLNYTSEYTSYLQGGGDLFVMGENPGYGAVRDAALGSFITALGGGNVAVGSYSGNSQTVASQFQTASQTSSVSFAAIGAFSSLGTGTCISADTSGNCGAAAWGVGTLSNAMQGALISVLDVNFLQTAYLQQPFIENLLGYLAQQQQISQGGGATNITSTVDAAGLASSPATLNPVFDGGTLTLDGTALNSFNFKITGNNGTIDLAGQSATIANPISDATSGTPGSLTVANSGTGGALTLSAANTYTGATTINSGATLALAGDGSIQASSGVADNGLFDISNANSAQAIANLTGSGTVNLGANTLITMNASGTFSGVIAGTGNFGVEGGSQTLSGQNTFTGQAGVNTGATLALAGDGSIGNTSNLIDEGTFDISGANGNRTVGGLTGAGTVVLGANSLGLTGATGTFAGTIGGTGGLAVLGGTQTLEGANTYTGATGIANGATLALAGDGSIASSSGVLDNGTLDLTQTNGATSISTLAGTGSVNLGANALVLTQANDTFSGSIGGAGGVTLNSGTQVLSGANSYTGGTLLNGGMLVANSIGGGTLTLNGGTFATGASFTGNNAVTLTGNGGTLDNAGHDDTFSGPISGAGHLTLTGVGTTTLSGSNTYSGGTTISNGIVAIDAANNLGTGSLTLDGGVLKTLAAITESAPISVTANGGAIDNMGFNNTISGAITGVGGMLFAGSGITTLTGVNTYTGGTTVETGTLQLADGGSLVGNVAVESGGQFLPGTASFSGSATNYGVTTLSSGKTSTFGGGFTNAGMLSGAGTIKGDVTNAAGGVFVAGNTVTTASGTTISATGGATTVQGNLTLQSGGNVVFAIAPTATPTAGTYGAAPGNSHTQINVTGNITLSGNATVYANAGSYLKTTYVLIDNPDPTATLTGTFSSVAVNGLSDNYGFYMTYNPDPQVSITVFPSAAFTPRAMTANQRNVAALLDGAVSNASGTLETSLNNLYMQSNADQTRTLDRLDGQMYANTVAVLTDSVRDSWDPVYSHLGLSRRVGANADKDVWINSTGSVGHLEGNDNADGVRTTTGGFLAGAQTKYSGWTLGGTAGVTHVGATRDYAGDTLSATLWQTGVYASHPVGTATAGLLLGYTQGPVSYGDASQTARIASAQARIAKTIELGGGNALTPLLGLDAAHIDLNGTQESDPALGLTVPGQHTSTADARFMLRFDHAWQIRSTDWVASVGAGMRQLLGTSATSMTLGLNGIPGQLFTVQGTGMSRTVGEFTAGVSAHFTDRLSLDVNYEGQVGGHTRNNALAGRVNWLF